MLDQQSQSPTDVPASAPVEETTKFKWTDEKVEIVKTMWADRKSASQIAEKIPGASRLAVCGKLNRLGLKRTGTAARGTRWTNPDRARRRERDRERSQAVRLGLPPVRGYVRTAPRPEPLPSSGELSPAKLEQLFPVYNRRLFNDLEPWQCRYPVGDPTHEGFFFCGAERIENSSYCGRCTTWCSPYRADNRG